VTTPEIIDHIHELILEDRRILAKSIAEQLGTSRERVGSIIHEDLDIRKLSAKWAPKCLNADQKRQRCQSSEQVLEFFSRDRNDFLSRLVSMDETCLYNQDQETKQQSMEWRHSSSPPTQKTPHWLSSKGPNYQRGVFFISSGVIHGHFELKNPRESHQTCLVLARQCFGSLGTWNPEETGLPGLPVFWLPTLFSGSDPV